ncbi:MAG TPA: uroporphyrinogen-III synthase, partial [bacterium]
MTEAEPLRGLTFLNTRDARGAATLTQMLAELGAEVVECPTIQFIAPESWVPFDSRLEQLTEDDWVVFTSANAVRATLERLWELNRPPAVLGRGHLAVIGRGTKNALERHKLSVALMPGI